MRSSTLYHLLKGKRTTSVLSFGYFYQLLTYFALFPKAKEKEYQQVVNELSKSGLIKESNKKLFVITEKGKKYLEENWEADLGSVNQLKYYKWDKSFFDLLVFASQVISEKAYKNKQYLPIEANLFKQQQLKKWIKGQEGEGVNERLYFEWEKITAELPNESQELILAQLVGHQEIGMTLFQIAEKNNRDVILNYLLFKNSWHHLLTVLISDPSDYPLFYSLLQTQGNRDKEPSSQQTTELYKQGYSLENIAVRRHLKISTVTDHLIEHFIVEQDYGMFPVISEQKLAKLAPLLLNKPDYVQWTFKETLELCPELSFYEFKFYQFKLFEEEKLNA